MPTGMVSPQSVECVKDKLKEMGYSLDEIENAGVNEEDLKTAMNACNIGRISTRMMPIRTRSDGVGASIKKLFGFE